MFHMGWFTTKGWSVYGWNDMWSGNAGREFGTPQLMIDIVTSLERASFDYLMLEDASVLPDTFEGGFGYSVEAGTVRHDPMPLVPLLAAHTKRLGIVATACTTFYHPFMAARLFRTLNHLTNGRVGINLVTGSPHSAAQKFGYPKHFEHDLRYEMADEWMDCVTALWDTWDHDAIVLDEEKGWFGDPFPVRQGPRRRAKFVGSQSNAVCLLRAPLTRTQTPPWIGLSCKELPEFSFAQTRLVSRELGDHGIWTAGAERDAPRDPFGHRVGRAVPTRTAVARKGIGDSSSGI
jgi:alkanesulfonate monooxygenase SsuD/methylene tetrahydromethanopterin reductase-like flavin-dependent oxidoreductase (luciferase family)